MASTSSPTKDEWEPKHIIFLSHSGAQKDFVEQLCVDLERVNHFPFFDKRPHSLPKGARFPELILKAARQCKLAVVVLSKEFVTSKWPMVELVTFVEQGSIQILPLFYKLSIEDCSKKENIAVWRKKWEKLASKDSHGFDPQKCEAALRNVLSWNGERFDKSLGGEVTYRERIVSSICRKISPNDWVTRGLVGGDRLCQIVVNDFKKAKSLYSCQAVPVLGLHGVGGIGKSTLCWSMCSHFHSEFSGKVWHMELPTEPTENQVLKQLRLVLQSLSEAPDELLKGISTVNQAKAQLKNHMRSRKVFLAVDNVWDNKISMRGAKAVLDAGFAEGSKVLVTARTEAVLEKLLGPQSSRMPAPSLSECEAFNILLETAVPGCELSMLPKAELHILEEVVKQCHCHPLAVTVVGGTLSRLGRDTSGWEERVKKLRERKQEWEDEMSELIDEGYTMLSDELKQVFLDVAVFVPFSLGRWDITEKINVDQASDWMNMVYERGKSMDLLEELRKCAILDWVTPSEEIRIHDFFREFAFQKVRKFDDSRCIYLEDRDDLASELDWGEVERIAVRRNGWLESLGKMKLEDSSAVKSLCVRECYKLKELSLGGMRSLRSLEISGCWSLSKLEGLSSLGSLRRLHVRRCPELFDEEKDRKRNRDELQELRASGSKTAHHKECQLVLGIENLVKLQELRLEYVGLNIWKLPIEKMVDLRKLECREWREGKECGVREITGLSSSSEELTIVNSGEVYLEQVVPNLTTLGKLRVLELEYCTMITGFLDLTRFPMLEQLVLEKCPKLTGFQGSSSTIRLLQLRRCKMITGFLDLTHFPRLEQLVLEKCPKLTGVKGSSSTLRQFSARAVGLCGSD